MLEGQILGAEGKGTVNQADRELHRIAVPAMLGYLGLIAYQVVDVFWIGRLGAEAVAGVGAVAFLQWVVFGLMHLSGTGCATLVAQAVGARDRRLAHRVAAQATVLSIGLSLLLVVMAALGQSQAFSLMGLEGATLTAAQRYFEIFVPTIPLHYLVFLGERIFSAYGDTRTNTVIVTSALLLNAILDPLLMFGWFGLPALGVSGAAFATMLSEAIALVAKFVFLRRRGYLGPVTELLRPGREHLRTLLRIGTPTVLTNVTWSFVYPLLVPVLTRFGVVPLACLSIAHRIEGVPYFASLGFSIAVATLVGQAYGRRDAPSVIRTAARGTVLITLYLLPVSLLFLLVPEFFFSLLNDDPAVIAEGARYLRIVGLFEVCMGWELVLEGAFNGLGNTRGYMFLAVPLTLFRIPLAWLLAITCGLGPAGVWWAIGLSTCAKGLCLFLAFRTNRTNRTLLAALSAEPCSARGS
ncbi:MAG: hypothetical protein A2284_13860 [Deltaproteobacteria bacterium RIFOXYA12_FULL_61_11]|nr:MAG: hypothetical protein A2284_13860 [Deltaproteobacteria bacterium RIFOXYA12_FULL_61_11]